MTRIKSEPNLVHPVPLEEIEMRSDPVLRKGKDDSGGGNVQNQNISGAGSNPASPEQRASKSLESNLQANARAAELNLQLKTQYADQPKTGNTGVIPERNITTVHEGESMADVAKRTGVSEQALKQANPKLKEPIRAGQELKLPEQQSPETSSGPKNFGTYDPVEHLK